MFYSRVNFHNCTSVNFRTLHVMIQPKRAEIVDILMINFPLLSSHSFFTLSQCNTRNHKHYTPNENAMQTPNGTIIIKCVKSPRTFTSTVLHINKFFVVNITSSVSYTEQNIHTPFAPFLSYIIFYPR